MRTTKLQSMSLIGYWVSAHGDNLSCDEHVAPKSGGAAYRYGLTAHLTSSRVERGGGGERGTKGLFGGSQGQPRRCFTDLRPRVAGSMKEGR